MPAPTATEKFVNWITGVPMALFDATGSIFNASGSNSTIGLVPDPGSVAGTTRFLREDATWADPLSGAFNSFPNLLINADGVVDQRSNGAAATTTDDTYGSSDRWYTLTQTASISVQRQQNGADGIPWYQRLTQTQAAAQRMGRAQIIEGKNCTQVRGSTVVLSGKIRCSSSQAIRYAILEWSGTEDTVTSDVVLDWTSTTYTINNFFINNASLSVIATGSVTPAAATWTSLTELTLAADTNLNNLIVFIWTEGTAAQNVTLDLGWIKLENNSVATQWVPPTITEETLNCQRYAYLLKTSGTGRAETATLLSFPFVLNPPMRTTPTASSSDLLGTIQARDFNGAVTRTCPNPTLNAFLVSETGGYFEILPAVAWTPANWTIGNLGFLNCTSVAGSGLLISAEL